jgi:hypothetical protein
MSADPPERGSNLPLWLLGVVVVGGAALLGLRAPQLTPATPKPAESAKGVQPPAADTDEQDLSRGPLSVLRKHFRVIPARSSLDLRFALKFTTSTGVADSTVSIEANSAEDEDRTALNYYVGLEPALYEFLIATVPDPVHSKFKLEFDNVVNGIQRAFEARDFTLRTYWLPWPRFRNPETAGKVDRSRHDQPGAMLFRKNKPEKENGNDPKLPTLALVCLVGETPTAGIHMPALTRSLELREKLDRALEKAAKGKRVQDSPQWADKDAPIRIVAPYFSGSQSSLVLALKKYPRAFDLHIISGSASALAPYLFEDLKERKTLSLQTTVVPNVLVTKAVFTYLSGHRGLDLSKTPLVPGRVAILREANTVFGLAWNQQNQDDLLDWVEEGVIDIPFPLSIAQLQVEAGQLLGQGPGAGLPRTEFVEPHMPIAKEAQAGVPEPYDPLAAASTAGQSLRTILLTIQRARVRYVGIVATDIRDVVFLNRLIRRECPDVRVFTTEPSIALTHPDDAYDLRGMIVGSTYPLHPVTQYWSRNKDNPNSLIPFPDQGSQGYYNAVLAQFGTKEDRERMLDYRPPGLKEFETKEKHPPIWISVVSGGRLIPVHCYTDFSFKADAPEIDKAKAPEIDFASGPTNSASTPLFPISLGVVLASWAAAVALAIALTIVTVDWSGRWRVLEVGPSDSDTRQERWIDALWIWVWRGLLLGSVLLFALPFSLPAREFFVDQWGEADWRHRVFLVPAAVMVAVEITLVTVALFIHAIDLSRINSVTEDRASWKDRLGYLALACVIALPTAVTWYLWSSTSQIYRLLFYFRASDLSSGLSPLVPMGLVAAAGGVVSFTMLRQRSKFHQKWLSCPYDDLSGEIHQADHDLRYPRLIGQNCRQRWLLLGSGIVFASGGFWLLSVVALPSEEGFLWDNMMRLAFLVTTGAVGITLARFLGLWSRLKSLLEKIAQVPMVGAFERLPDEVRRFFRGLMYSRLTGDHQLATVAWALPKGQRQELAEAIAANRPPLAWVFGQSVAATPTPGDECEFRAAREWLIERLKDYAKQYLTVLSANWVNRPIDAAFGRDRPVEEKAKSGEEEKADEADTGNGQAAGAEEYLAAYIAVYLGQYFVQLRRLAYALACAMMFLVLAAASYDFQPQQPGLHALVVLLGAVVAGIAYVLFQINRDGIISRIARTTPHRFSPDMGFLSSVWVYVLPAVLILVAHVFGLFRFVLEPILGLFQ